MKSMKLAEARQAVAQTEAQGLGVVAAFGRLQVARAAAAQGALAEGLDAALDAIPGLAVAAELGDAGLVLRWQGDPRQAWGGLGPGSREAGDERAWLEGGLPLLADALVRAAGRAEAPAVDALVEATHRAGAGRPWLASSPRWPALLTRVEPVLMGLMGRPRGPAPAQDPPASDAAVWSTLDRAVDPHRAVTHRFAATLGAVVSLATGGAPWRPLRIGAAVALLRYWRRAVDDQPFNFRQPGLRRDRLDELATPVALGDLVATAEVLRTLADGVAVKLPWELEAWLAAPFEGVDDHIHKEGG